MATWDEVKRLAADFQKIQLSSTTQRLSERNCIEIVSWLTEKKILDLIFTTDGKEYLTPSQLITEIKIELHANGGRINLVELAKSINVDLSHVNAHLNEILRNNKEIQLVLGQLIDNSYVARIAGEINQKLSQQGQINVSDLTIQYDLPSDFLRQQVLERNLGKAIFGKQDKSEPRIFFTESFIARTNAKIGGAVSGLTKPTAVASILGQCDVNERLFFSLFDAIVGYGSLTGRSAGAQYVPHIYSRSQNEWARNFFKQNGYLEFDALSRLGVSDHGSYIRKQFSDEEPIFLNSCVASRTISQRIEADVDECVESKSYVDLRTNLPSVFDETDIELLLKSVLTDRNRRKSSTMVVDGFVLSKTFVEKLSKECEKKAEENARAAVENGQYELFRTGLSSNTSTNTSRKDSKSEKKIEEPREKSEKQEERRRKAAIGKSSGGLQGRETKTKSVSKKYKTNNKSSENDRNDSLIEVEKNRLEIVTQNEVRSLIEKQLSFEEENLIDLADSLTELLAPDLNRFGLETAEKFYSETIADRTSNRKQTHNELQNKLNLLINDVRLFEKGIKVFDGNSDCDLQKQLTKYLLKTLCNDVLTEILNYVALELNSNVRVENLSVDQRGKFVDGLPVEFGVPMRSLVKSVASGNGVDEFLVAVERGLTACSMIVKKVDKKKDRAFVSNHKSLLLDQLGKCDDPALVLHLAVLVLFVKAHHCVLHASGRHVSGVLGRLKGFLAEGDFVELASYHDFVTLMLSNGSEAENAREKLKEKVPVIKNIAMEFKKASDKNFN